MESAKPPSMPRSAVWLAIVMAIGVLGLVASLGPVRGNPTYHVIRGRIEVPPDVILPSRLQILRSRGGEVILAPPQPPGSATWKVSVAPDGRSATFSVYVDEGGPVDLQLAIDEAGTPLGSGPAGSPTPTDGERRSAHAANAPASDRSVFPIGDHVGFVRDVDPDAQDVVMRLVPRVAGRLRLHVVDPEGWDVAGVQVEFRSMLDSYAGRTDAEGRAVLEDVSVLDGVATAEVPKQRTASLVRGKVRATPGEAEVTLPLRKGVRMRVRLPEGVARPTYLSFARPGATVSTAFGWSPDALDTIEVLLEPDWPRVTLRAHAPDPEIPAFSLTTAETTCAVVEGAEVLLEPAR